MELSNATTPSPISSGNDPLATNREEDPPGNEKVIVSVRDDYKISASTITGIALGAGALCIMGLVSSRRFFRRNEDDEEDSE
jgi:hypothetical protein